MWKVLNAMKRETLVRFFLAPKKKDIRTKKFEKYYVLFRRKFFINQQKPVWNRSCPLCSSPGGLLLELDHEEGEDDGDADGLKRGEYFQAWPGPGFEPGIFLIFSTLIPISYRLPKYCPRPYTIILYRFFFNRKEKI